MKPALNRTICSVALLAGLAGMSRAQYAEGDPPRLYSPSQSATTVRVGQPVTLTVHGEDIDVEGDPQAIQDMPIWYRWGASGGVISGTGGEAGYQTLTTSTSSTVTVTFYSIGEFIVSCEVEDRDWLDRQQYPGPGVKDYKSLGEDWPNRHDFTITVVGSCSPLDCDCTGTSVGGGPGGGSGGSPGGGSGGSGGSGGGGGPSEAASVDLKTGAGTVAPSIALFGSNAAGPSAHYGPAFSTEAAGVGYSSPGLPIGWTDAYDYKITGPTTGWEDLTLVGPSGGIEQLMVSGIELPDPLVAGVQVAFPFIPLPPKAYAFFGETSSTVGRWNSLSILFRDGTRWTFARPAVQSGDRERYVLRAITDSFGKGIVINRNDATDVITSIADASTPSVPLLSFSYQATTGLLERITDVSGSRSMVLGYGSATGVPEIVTVSQVGGPTANPPAQWTFEYTTVNGAPWLYQAGAPNPATGQGISEVTLTADAIRRVSTMSDANGNVQSYTYDHPTIAGKRYPSPDPLDPGAGTYHPSTRVEVRSGSTVVRRWYQKWTDDTPEARDAGVCLVDQSQAWPETSRRSTFLTHDAWNRVLTYQDPKGQQTTFNYNDFFGTRSESITTPRGAVLTRTFSTNADYPFGRLETVEVTDTLGTPLMEPTSLTYDDANGRPLVCVEATTGGPWNGSSDETLTYSWDYAPTGNLTDLYLPGGDQNPTRHTGLEYGPNSRAYQPDTLVDALGKETHFSYDGRGNLSTVTDAVGHTTQFYYNLSDQVEWIQWPATTGTGNRASRQFIYLYPGGPLKQVLDYPETATLPTQTSLALRYVTYVYGPEGEVKSVVRNNDPYPAGAVTYNALYDVASVVDGNGSTTWYDYTNLGDLYRIRYPGYNMGTHYDILEYGGFDALGNPGYRIDGKYAWTRYTYDPLDGRLATVAYGTQPPSVRYEYIDLATGSPDPLGRLTQKTDISGVTTYIYDGVGNPRTVSTQYKDGSTPLFTTSLEYAYWSDGSRRQMVASPGGTFTYGLDGVGRPASLTGPAGTVSWQYYDNGWLSRQSVQNHSTTDYTYNARGFLTQLFNRRSNGTLVSGFTGPSGSSMAYDPLGNLTSFEATGSVWGATEFTYHPGRGTLWTEFNIPGGYYWYEHLYDDAENPTTLRSMPLPTYNPDNQFAYQQGAMEHDGNGDPYKYFGANLGFDPEGNLSSYQLGLVNVTYGYNAEGLRVWRQDGPNPANRIYFLYDGTDLVGEMNSAGQLQARHTTGANGLVSRWTPGSGEVYYSYNPIGDVSDRLNSAGSILSTDVYDAFGQQLLGLTTDPYGYKGQYGYYTDRPATNRTDLILTTFRYYDPDTGRFLTRDPISYLGGLNLYGYVQGNPVNLTDPLGLAYRIYGKNGKLVGPGDPYFDEIQNSLDILRSDPRSRQLLMRYVDAPESEVMLMISQPTPSDPIFGHCYSNLRQKEGKRLVSTIVMDTNITYEFTLKDKSGRVFKHTAPNFVILAHELGHAIYDYKDDVEKTGQPGTNVSVIENRIRRIFGLAERIVY